MELISWFFPQWNPLLDSSNIERLNLHPVAPFVNSFNNQRRLDSISVGNRVSAIYLATGVCLTLPQTQLLL